jgi:hypothetical protein
LRAHFKGGAEVAVTGCAALCSLALSDENKSRLGNAGACVLVIQMMRHYASNAKIIEECCFVMTNLMSNHDINTQIFSGLRGCEVLVGAMNSFSQNPDVLIRDFGTIRNFLSADNHATILLGKLGACEIVCKAVREYHDNIQLVWKGCWAMENLCFNKKELVKFGGCEVAVSALNKHSHHLELCTYTCGAIEKMSKDNSANAERLRECNTVESLMLVFSMHSERSLNFASKASSCMCNLAFSSLASQERLGDLGACEALVIALALHPAATEHFAYAIWLLIVKPPFQQAMAFLHPPGSRNESNKVKFEAAKAKNVLQSIIANPLVPRPGIIQARDALSLFSS